MANIRIVLEIPEEDAPNYLLGIVEKYPNETVFTENPLPDEVWAMHLPKRILTDLVSDGLRMRAVRLANQQDFGSIDATLEVTLPDGTILNG